MVRRKTQNNEPVIQKNGENLNGANRRIVRRQEIKNNRSSEMDNERKNQKTMQKHTLQVKDPKMRTSSLVRREEIRKRRQMHGYGECQESCDAAAGSFGAGMAPEEFQNKF